LERKQISLIGLFESAHAVLIGVFFRSEVYNPKVLTKVIEHLLGRIGVLREDKLVKVAL
jgi:hypothetical protein